MSLWREQPGGERVVEGEIVGYRVWVLGSTGGLASPVIGDEWTAGVNTAALFAPVGPRRLAERMLVRDLRFARAA